MEQVCMKIDSSLNLIDNVITNGCSQWSYRLLIWCTFHLRPKFTANNKNNTIRVPINSQVCILYAQKMKRKHSFLPTCIIGRHKNWVWLAQKFEIIVACPSSPYFVTCWDMAMQKSLFDIVRPSTLRKPEKRKPESDTDQGDDTQVKKHKFCPKWLGEFHWLKYDSTEKQMKCTVCLEIMRMAENLILHKIFCMEQIIWSWFLLLCWIQ